jgi:hypothetical protein
MNNPFDSFYDAPVQREEAKRSLYLQCQEESVRPTAARMRRSTPSAEPLGAAILAALSDVPWPRGTISALPGRMLCITDDGFFVRNPGIPSREGFEVLPSAHVTELSDHVAEHVRLLHQASLSGPIWTHQRSAVHLRLPVAL